MRLGADFFARDVLEVAPELVGKMICRQLPDGRVLRGMITETEAYRGKEDLACHARMGKTKRNAVMFGPAGYAYIYLIYGIHWLFNIVTGEDEDPQAVLIRALEKPWDGPGKWTKAFCVTGDQNGLYLPSSQQLWLEEGQQPDIITAPRVGIDYAGEPWKSIPWRFIAK